jgi:hypothetical protein
LWEQVWVVIYGCGVEVAEKIAEVPIFGAEVPHQAQRHQNSAP